MTTITKPGPYTDEDGEEVYLPVSAYTLNEARRTAAEHAAETIGGWGRTRYTGRRDLPLHDHEDWEGCEDEETCPKVPCWCFETYEGTYRESRSPRGMPTPAAPKFRGPSPFGGAS